MQLNGRAGISLFVNVPDAVRYKVIIIIIIIIIIETIIIVL
jgi:hypothetical protein